MAKAKKKKRNVYDEYPDDIFKDTRMSFGEHIEELRTRMLRALKWLMFFLVFGFILDGIGEALGKPSIGVGKPVLKLITDPVEEQVRDFYNRRIERVAAEKLLSTTDARPEEIVAIRAKLRDNRYDLTALSAEERRKLRFAYEPMPVRLKTGPLAAALGLPPEQVRTEEVEVEAEVIPATLTYLTEKGHGLLEFRQHLTTLSVQEGFVIYFKVSLLCGIVLASPFILYEFWAFVGAGLYPHEKRYVRMLFLPSLGLFLSGIALCQWLVLPGAVKALLAFNEWLGFDPDIRLREWLGLAIILPLVFGLSFQTPLVMIALNRIGTFTYEDYLSKWRYAVFILAVFAALITPTPDVVTMLYLFAPMFGLYMLGVAVCYFFPGELEEDEEIEEAEEIAV